VITDHIPVGLARRQFVSIVTRLTESATLRAFVQVTVLVTVAYEALVNGALDGLRDSLIDLWNLVSTVLEEFPLKYQNDVPDTLLVARPQGPGIQELNGTEKAVLSVVEAFVPKSLMLPTASIPSRAICTASNLSRSIRVEVFASTSKFPATIEPMANIAIAKTSSIRLNPLFVKIFLFIEFHKI